MPPSASSSRCTLAGACTLIAFYTIVSVVYFRDHLLGRGAELRAVAAVARAEN